MPRNAQRKSNKILKKIIMKFFLLYLKFLKNKKEQL